MLYEVITTFRNLCIMLQHAGKLWSLSEWASGLRYLFVNPGILRRVAGAWMRYFSRDFHPWQVDNRHLVGEWEREQRAAAGPHAGVR